MALSRRRGAAAAAAALLVVALALLGCAVEAQAQFGMGKRPPKPKAPIRREDLPLIKCQVCEGIAKQALKATRTLKEEAGPGKVRVCTGRSAPARRAETRWRRIVLALGDGAALCSTAARWSMVALLCALGCALPHVKLVK